MRVMPQLSVSISKEDLEALNEVAQENGLSSLTFARSLLSLAVKGQRTAKPEWESFKIAVTLTVENATEAVKHARDDYNKIAARYGATSTAARDARNQVARAEQAEDLAMERAHVSRGPPLAINERDCERCGRRFHWDKGWEPLACPICGSTHWSKDDIYWKKSGRKRANREARDRGGGPVGTLRPHSPGKPPATVRPHSPK
jgi:rubrerythrin